MDWTERIEQMKFKENHSWTECAKEVQKYFPELDIAKAKEKARGHIRKCDQYEGKKKYELKKAKQEKIVVFENLDPIKINEKWAGNKIIKFGLIGDTHINSKYCQLTHLHTFYDICQQKGIGIVYHAGDIDEGERMRPGHQYECYNQGADDHVAEIVKVYPKRDGIITKFITGNHDASMIKHCGYNIGPAISARRDDMEYLGSDCAIIHLTPNCTLELRHPWNGSSYAVSYQAQKIVEAMDADSKPNILAVGHYHKAGEFFPRNVHTFLTGAFQSQTPFTRGKGLEVHMAGWIVEIEVDESGTIKEITSTRIPFYKAIADDYKRWSVVCCGV